MADVTVFCDIACELGEGPSYDPNTDTLWWFDIVGRKLLSRRFGDEKAEVQDLPFMASMLARIDERRQLVVAEDGIYVRESDCGAFRLLRPLEADNEATRSNDGRVHPCGALWVGTMGKKAEEKAGAIYWFFEGELRVLYTGISIPNSICFAPDGASAYFADTQENRIKRVACDPATGLPTGEPEIFLDNTGNKGWPDGSVCDAEGNVWNARWGAGSLDKIAPAGERVQSFALPASRTTCPAFVGREANRIAVTSAWQGMGEVARAAEPQAGFTFLVEVPVTGRFEPDVKV